MWPEPLKAERQGGEEGPGLGYLLLKLIGQEQELASGEAPDIELAEVLEFTVDLLLADPRPPPDGEDQHRRADTGVIGARKILGKQNRERFMQLKTLENLERTLPGAGAETREGREEPVYVGLDRKTEGTSVTGSTSSSAPTALPSEPRSTRWVREQSEPYSQF